MSHLVQRTPICTSVKVTRTNGWLSFSQTTALCPLPHDICIILPKKSNCPVFIQPSIETLIECVLNLALFLFRLTRLFFSLIAYQTRKKIACNPSATYHLLLVFSMHTYFLKKQKWADKCIQSTEMKGILSNQTVSESWLSHSLQIWTWTGYLVFKWLLVIRGNNLSGSYRD